VEGGLTSYGTDIAQSFAPAASSIDRILKGETPADLPLQPPSRYDVVLNLKTAKAMGLNVPAGVLGPEASRASGDALRKEAKHLDEVGWYTRAQDFFDGADALDALNKHDSQ
jgi:ABC-type uncharacterized transport system substrate-binding protein